MGIRSSIMLEYIQARSNQFIPRKSIRYTLIPKLKTKLKQSSYKYSSHRIVYILPCKDGINQNPSFSNII